MGVYEQSKLSSNVYSIVENDKFGEQPVVYLIVGDEKSALIDTGLDTADLAAFIRKGFGDKVIDNLFIINTHCHFDHVGANYRFPNSNIYVSSHGKELLSDKTLNMSEASGFELEHFDVTHWVEDKEKIFLSSTDHDNYLEILHTPGHSPDSLCVWYPKGHRLFVGDMVYRRYPVICFTPKSDINELNESAKKMVRFIDREEERGGYLIHLSSGHIDNNLESQWLRKFSLLLQDVVDGRVLGTTKQDKPFTYYSTQDGLLSLKHGAAQIQNH